MPEGPFGVPRLTSVGPFTSGECDIPIHESRKVRKVVESELGDDLLELDEEGESEVIRRLERIYGNPIGSGSGRIVFGLSEECVLKVSKNFNPFQNKSEALSYNEKLTSEQKRRFAPVVNTDNDYRWITMRRSEREPTDEEFIQASKEVVLEHGIDLIDFQKANFGVVDDRVVVIDYGSGINSIEEADEWSTRQEAWSYINDNITFN